MSSRRTLLSRARRDDSNVSSPAQRRPRDSEASASRRDATPLPAYEAPSCPLNAKAKRDLEELYSNRSTAKYKKHLQAAKQSVIASAVEPTDRLHERQKRLKQYAERRRQPGRENEQKTDAEMEEQDYAEDMEKKVDALTSKAEKALRDLIDYSDELAAQDDLMQQVNQQIPAYNAQASAEARRRRRARANDSDAEGEDEAEEEEAPAEDPEILSAVEIFNQLKEEHKTAYAEKSMRQRYATNNDYIGFKAALHDAQHPGPDAPPVPKAGTWFPGEADDSVPSNPGAAQRRRLANRTDNTQNEDDSEDEDMVIAGVTTSLKCPLTLRLMVHPYSNKKCPHSFEKAPIIDYVRKEAVVFNPNPRQRAPAHGPKTVQCPQAGCEARLSLSDFFEDPLLKRQVQRAAKAEASGFGEDDNEDDEGENYQPRGTQQNAEHIDDDGEDEVGDAAAIKEEAKRQTLLRVKRERLNSRGPSMAPSRQSRGANENSSSEPDDDDIEALESSEPDEDEIDEL